MKKLIMILISLVGFSTYGQEIDSTRNKLKWVNEVQLGQMFSNNEGLTGKFSASFMSGVKRNNLSIGIELGYNDYEFFKLGSAALVGRYNLRKSGNSPYAYGLFGYGLPMYIEDTYQIDASSSKGGILTGGGLGVDFPLGKVSLTLQLGYKFQKSTYDEPSYYYYDWLSSFAPGNNNDFNYTTRKMNRIEFKIGMRF